MQKELPGVRDVARAIVNLAAPDEGPVFDGLADTYFDEGPAKAWLDEAEQEVGSGLDVQSLILTLVILPTVAAVLKPSAEALGEKLRDVSRGTLRDVLAPYAKQLLEQHKIQLSKVPDRIKQLPEAKAKLLAVDKLYADALERDRSANQK